MNSQPNLVGSLVEKFETGKDYINDLSNSIFFEIIGHPNNNQNGWEEFKLGERFKFQTGKTLSKSEMNPHGEYKVYGGNGVLGHHSDYLFLDQKVLIGRVGANCGNTLISSNKSWVTSNAIIVHADEEDFDKYYLAKMLELLDLNRLATGAAQKYISTQTIKKLTGIKPPMPIQKKFSKLQKLIVNLEKKVTEREALVIELKETL